MKPIIEITGLGKKYPIIHEKACYGTLRDTIMNSLHHPFASKKTHESFWALKDINLTVNRGDIVGIIGRNGTGKSTLLKILSGITKPTEGKVKLWGRVSSLLEVGTGFHPELTGRENIYLNGVILGMTRKEVSKKFDEIVAFAGIERFLDTQVKHYSSGMYMRLAFSVAAHLEPDILIVDEVLAVGDAEFQKKCLGKMEEVSKEQGRTVIFVSHNLDVVQSISQKVAYISDGHIKQVGKTIETVDAYMSDTVSYQAKDFETKNKSAFISKVRISDENGNPSSNLPISLSFTIDIEYTVTNKLEAVLCFLFFADSKILYAVTEADKEGKLRLYMPGKYRATLKIPEFFFNVGTYRLDISIQVPSIEYLDTKEGFNFRIISDSRDKRNQLFGGKVYGHMASLLPIETKKLQ